MRTLATGLKWGEGVRSVGGAIWVSDTQGSRLWTDEGSHWEHFELRTPSNGLWHVDGQLVAAMMHEPRIGVWDGAEFDTYADLSDVTSGPLGDMIGDAQGRLYVDDVGYALHRGEAPKPGRVLCVEQNGHCWVAAENLGFPNGLAFIDDGTTLVIAETDRGILTAFDVDEYGRLSNRRLYADITAVGPPGSRIDDNWPDGDGVWAALFAAVDCCVTPILSPEAIASGGHPTGRNPCPRTSPPPPPSPPTSSTSSRSVSSRPTSAGG